MSGKATAEQIAAEIKAAGAKKQAASYRKNPGQALVEEFLVPFYPADLSDLANRTGISYSRLQKLVRNQDKIDNEMANKLSSFFGKPASYFLQMQEHFETGGAL